MTAVIDPIDLRSFPPVPPLSRIPETWRQTFISKHTECPRSSYLYLKYDGGALTHPLAGGTLLHRAIQRYIQLLWDNDERIGNPEFAKDILNEVLVESTDLNVSPDRFDSLRSMMFHVAEGLAIDPEKILCLETPVSVEINGHTLTGTIDFAETDDLQFPNTATFIDWKSAFYNAAQGFEEDDEEYVPTKEEWPGTFQLVLYAYCATVGAIDGFAGGLPHQNFRLKQIHPRQFWENEGTMAYREAVISRETLLDWRFYLEAEVAKLERAFEDWKFPAIIGSHCDYCPASAECPIPAPLREWRGEIRSAEDAERAAILWERAGAFRSAIWAAIKGYSKRTGRPIRYGRDLELRWRKTESEKLRDKVDYPGSRKKVKGREALKAAIVRAETTGIPVEWESFFTTSVSTRLQRRTLTPEQLVAERAASKEDDQ